MSDSSVAVSRSCFGEPLVDYVSSADSAVPSAVAGAEDIEPLMSTR